MLSDENAKKVATGDEGIFNVTLVFACVTISSIETAEDVSAWIERACEQIEVLELLLEDCLVKGGARKSCKIGDSSTQEWEQVVSSAST